MYRKILVTGGLGVIGSSVVRQCLDEGYIVHVLDKNTPASSLVADLQGRKDVLFFHGDCRQREVVWQAIREVDAVVHLASASSFHSYEIDGPTEYGGAVVGFLTVLDAMVTFGVAKVVFASSSAVYEGNPLPYREDMFLDPPDLKSLAKLACEELAALYSRRHGITALALRPFSVYGHDETRKGKLANIVSLVTWALLLGRRPIIWGDGSQARDFIFADDVARAFRLALSCNVSTQAINVGSGTEHTFLDVVSEVNYCLGTDIRPVFSEVPVPIYATRLLADTSTANRVLGFTPEVDFRRGVATVVRESCLRRSTLKDNRFDLMQVWSE